MSIARVLRLSLAGLPLCTAALGTQLRAQDHAHHAAVGTVSFPVSCDARAQERMNVAVAMLHSFWFPEARKAFEAAAAADSTCGMAYWGIALTHFGNPLAGGSGPAEQAKGAAAAARGVQVGGRSVRERAYLDAVATLYHDHATVPVRTRLQHYEAALERLVAAHPSDTEAQIFHAIIIVANAPPSDMTYARQQVAARTLTALHRRQPTHPGLAHYIIHAFDAPSLAHLALDAARQYASIAPDAPHALHMPSHTFTRLGYWDESIATNRRSADAESVVGARAHPLDYLVYAYLQQGLADSARAAIMELTGNRELDYHAGTLGSWNGRAMVARYALEREDWKGAQALPVLEDPPSVKAITQFARALGAARAGDVAAARAEQAALAATVAALTAANDAYWAHVVGAQHRAVEAWVAHLEGRHEDALRLAREAADAEDAVEKHPVTPGPFLPARELYGDILMAHGRSGEALAAYEATMKREPNRLRTLYGAARAARALGRQAEARKYYAEILALLKPAATHPARAEALAYTRG